MFIRTIEFFGNSNNLGMLCRHRYALFDAKRRPIWVSIKDCDDIAGMSRLNTHAVDRIVGNVTTEDGSCYSLRERAIRRE